jgi:sarcosine oxidase
MKGRPHTLPSRTDVVVIGGGVVGAATARAIARRGGSVALLEKGSLTTAQGSSRGTARIIAPAPYPDAEYLEMALRALDAWRALDGSLLEMTGALYAGGGIERFTPAWAAAGVEVDRLTSAEVERRFGVVRLPPEPILFQPDAGVIRADRAREALLRSAVEAGAAVHQHERVIRIEPGEDGAKLRTTRRSWHCRQAIVTAGPWTRDLLDPLGMELPLTVSSQSVAYFDLGAVPAKTPAVMEFDGDEPYALIDPGHGLKAALHARGPETSPAGRWELIDTNALERIETWARARFPGLGDLDHTEACLYTSTPDERFVSERHGPVIVSSACSGQGFQFAPATGESLAALVELGAPI